MADEREAIRGDFERLREASKRVPGLSPRVARLEAAVLGHLALIDAVFEAIDDDDPA